ncbi:hypothetical protein HK405_009759, partial [Cladochytrium tenue]
PRHSCAVRVLGSLHDTAAATTHDYAGASVRVAARRAAAPGHPEPRRTKGAAGPQNGRAAPSRAHLRPAPVARRRRRRRGRRRRLRAFPTPWRPGARPHSGSGRAATASQCDHRVLACV